LMQYFVYSYQRFPSIENISLGEMLKGGKEAREVGCTQSR